MFPEDTLFAYEHSIAMGGDVVDADVQLTADAVPIAFHDATLERTTDGTGKVANKAYSELASLDAGFNFAQDGKYPSAVWISASPRSSRFSRGFPTLWSPWI